MFKVTHQSLSKLPYFGISTLLYTSGIVVSSFIAGGDPAFGLFLAIGVALFWLLWFVFGLPNKPKKLYLFGLILLAFLTIFAVVCAGNLDDTYLRTNSLSHLVLDKIISISPKFSILTMHRNTLSGMLAVFTPLTVAYMYMGSRIFDRVFAGVMVLTQFIILLTTNSRSGLVSLVIGLLILGMLLWQSTSFKVRIFIGIGSSSLTCLAFIYLVFSGQYKLFNLEQIVNASQTGRLQLWKTTIYMLGDVPLTGFGLGRFREAYTFYLDPTNPGAGDYQEHAHNLFLQTYSDLGLLGFIAVVISTLVWAKLLFKCLNNNKYRLKSLDVATVTLRGGLAAYGAMLAYGLTDYSTWNGQFAPLFWIPLGIVASSLEPSQTVSVGFDIVNKVYRRLQINVFNGLHKSRLILVSTILIILAGLPAWQLLGFAETNSASLEKLNFSLGRVGINLTNIASHYNSAENILNWTSPPARGLAWVAVQSGDDTEAEKYLRQAVLSDSTDNTSLLLLGDLLKKQGRIQEALSVWRQGQAANIFLWRGRHFIDSPEDFKAEPVLLQSLEIDPHLWDSYHFLVMLYQRHGRTTDSITLLKKAASLMPADPRPIQELALLKQ